MKLAALVLLLGITVERNLDSDGFICLKVSGLSPSASGLAVTQVPPGYYWGYALYGQESFVIGLGRVPNPPAHYQVCQEFPAKPVPSCEQWVDDVLPTFPQPGDVPKTCKDLGARP